MKTTCVEVSFFSTIGAWEPTTSLQWKFFRNSDYDQIFTYLLEFLRTLRTPLFYSAFFIATCQGKKSGKKSTREIFAKSKFMRLFCVLYSMQIEKAYTLKILTDKK